MVAADVSRVTRAPFIWRIGYTLLASDTVRRACAIALRTIKAVFGIAAAQAVLERMAAAVVWSGWPRRIHGWVNIRASSFYSEMRRAVSPAAACIARRPPESRAVMRVGVFGAFRGLLSFQSRFFQAKPTCVQLYAYDVEYDGGTAPYLESMVDGYRAVRLKGTVESVENVAAMMVGDRLDMLINEYAKRDAQDLLDRIDVPCVAHICTGSDLLHHDGVSVQIYPQPSADFFPLDERLFCAVTESPVGRHTVYDGWILYDPRDIDVRQAVVPWRARERLIVCPGSLYKISAPAFLNGVMDLMEADSSLEFVFMGPDHRGALEQISASIGSRGLSPRAHYLGVFSHLRAEHGEIESDGWWQLCDLLRRARLWPDPWPVGAGSARFEAYLLGAPSVHMGLRTDPAVWGQSQPAVIDVPALHVDEGTAFTPADYRRLCERALYDNEFADRLAAAQVGVARRVSDASAFWAQLMARHEHWLQSRGHRLEVVPS